MSIKIIVYFLFCVTFASTVKVTFEGHSVYKVSPKTDDEVRIVSNIQKQRIGEFWLDQIDVRNDVRITVSPEKRKVFLNLLETNKIEYKVIIPDLQKAIDRQMKPAKGTKKNSQLFSFSWDRYHTLEEINNWLDELQDNYPNIVSTVVMGRSVENREIKGIKINYIPNRNNTYIGVIEGTIHAREWIVPATTTWIIKEFLTSTDPKVRAMAEDIEWHIFPVVNPDGYEYTFTTHRMWRKNRSTRNFTSCTTTGVDDDLSNGVDLNRNFDYVWMEIGASDNPCSNTFAGPSAFSEPEARAIADYVMALRTQGSLLYYYGLHSYTQLIVIPYSHMTAEEAAAATNYQEMFEIATRGATQLKKRYGTEYRVGVSADVMYPMSGTSFDWVKYASDVRVSLLIELRDLGEYGFLLPPEQIIPNNEEIMDALLEMDMVTRDLNFSNGTANLMFSIPLLLLTILSKLIIY